MTENLAYLPRLNGTEYSSSESKYYVGGYTGSDTSLAKVKTIQVSSTWINSFKTLGVFYNWTAANSACLKGWHLSDLAEWKSLVNYAGGEDIAGPKLKAISALWSSTDGSAPTTNTDEFGFSALPSGGTVDGTYMNSGEWGFWWSATAHEDSDYTATHAYPVYTCANCENVYLAGNYKSRGYAVRCVQD